MFFWLSLPALVCISNCFCFLVAFCLPLQSLFFLFVFSSSSLYDFPLPLSFLANYFLDHFAIHLQHIAYTCVWKKCMSLAMRVYVWVDLEKKRVQIFAHLYLQTYCGCLKFRDWGMEVMIDDRKATDCHMALTLGAAPVSSCSYVLCIYHLPHKIWSYLVRQQRRKMVLVPYFNSGFISCYSICIVFSTSDGKSQILHQQQIFDSLFRKIKKTCFQTS